MVSIPVYRSNKPNTIFESIASAVLFRAHFSKAMLAQSFPEALKVKIPAQKNAASMEQTDGMPVIPEKRWGQFPTALTDVRFMTERIYASRLMPVSLLKTWHT